jgi:hypothetical protein
MPLHDHFHPPWSQQNLWEGFQSAWVNTIVRHLNGVVLPQRFRAIPQVHLGPLVEFEVRVVDERETSRSVAVVELVCPGNLDRPENSRTFTTKCAAYLQERVNLMVVDIVTFWHQSFHHDICCLPAVADDDGLYAVSYRSRKEKQHHRLEVWLERLHLGNKLPTLPLWVANDLAVPLDLEKSYAETCQVLRIG